MLIAQRNDLQARATEMADVYEERSRRGAELIAKSNALLAYNSHAPRTIAYREFTTAGGTRATFERFWFQYSQTFVQP
jgi:hypothetical protein